MRKLSRSRTWAVVLACVAITAAPSPQPAAQPAPSPDPELQPYAEPGLLVDVGDGRKIHLVCMGRGSPTVIFSAGSGDWAAVWRKVQPAVAARTRTCAWDRAGFGLSSPSPQPQDVAHTTADLEKALHGGAIAGPYLLVGHSLGGLEMLLFADRHRRQVVGMVLVDPSFPGQYEALQRRPAFQALVRKSEQAAKAQSDHCQAEARAHPGDWAAMDPGCVAIPAAYPARLRAALTRLISDPDRWATRASLAALSVDDTHIASNPRRSYGDLPLIVLTAADVQTPPAGTALPSGAAEQMRAWQAQDWRRGHDALAALSTRGENRLVEGTSHYIQLIEPAAVIAAVNDVLAASRN